MAALLLGLSPDKQRRHVSRVIGESRHILSENMLQTFQIFTILENMDYFIKK